MSTVSFGRASPADPVFLDAVDTHPPSVTQLPVAERFRSQARFGPVGSEGQHRLAGSSVIIVGIGATGSAVAASLARAGVRALTLVDRDFVEVHNLPRQLLFTDDDVATGLPKAAAAAKAIRRLEPALELNVRVADFHAGNAEGLLAGHDLALDGTDNFAARYVLNDAAARLGIPWVYQAAVGGHGVVMAVPASGGPCLRCYQPSAPPAGSLDTCDTAGILHGTVMAVAGVAVVEALRILVGATPAFGRLSYLDVWAGSHAVLSVATDESCPVCSEGTYPALDEAAAPVSQLCGREAVHLRSDSGADLEALALRLQGTAPVVLANPHLLRFEAEGLELTVFADGRAIVKGTDDIVRAQGAYARYVGG